MSPVSTPGGRERIAAPDNPKIAPGRNVGRMSRLRPTTGALVILAATAAIALAANHAVSAQNYTYKPGSLSIVVGDSVTWSFSGEIHTVTSGQPGFPDGTFDSGIVEPGGTFQHTFNAPGSFPYFCQIHSEQMFGTIVVKVAATPKPPTPPPPTPRPSPRSTPRPTPPPTPPPTPAPSPTPTVTPLPSPSPSVTTEASASASASAVPSAAAESASPGPSAGIGGGGGDEAPGSALPIVGAIAIVGTAAAAFYLLRRRGLIGRR
jgi:plastocyanin